MLASITAASLPLRLVLVNEHLTKFDMQRLRQRLNTTTDYDMISYDARQHDQRKCDFSAWQSLAVLDGRSHVQDRDLDSRPRVSLATIFAVDDSSRGDCSKERRSDIPGAHWVMAQTPNESVPASSTIGLHQGQCQREARRSDDPMIKGIRMMISRQKML